MAKQTIVTAPAVQLKTTSGQYVHLYEGQPVPENADADQRKALLKAKMIGEVTVDEPTAAPAGPSPTSIEGILATVGTDVDKAKAALDAETAKGDKARPKLVEQLEAVVAGSGS